MRERYLQLHVVETVTVSRLAQRALFKVYIEIEAHIIIFFESNLTATPSNR